MFIASPRPVYITTICLESFYRLLREFFQVLKRIFWKQTYTSYHPKKAEYETISVKKSMVGVTSLSRKPYPLLSSLRILVFKRHLTHPEDTGLGFLTLHYSTTSSAVFGHCSWV